MHNTNTTINTGQMALIGLMTAILCIIAPISIFLPFSPVPLSLGTLAIYFVVTVLGMKRGIISVTLYLLLGFAGLPVFSGFSGGAGKLFGPTGGFIIGYLFIALICGAFVDKWYHRPFICILGMLLGTAVCYAFGTIWLAREARLTFSSALVTGVLPFILGDLIKLALAMTIGYQVRNRLNRSALL
ncbi:MAG: biotin transporter BioY [Lachnospiraceae bacterium]|nr:biotin transporter BioY [Lachnospiraceae bacterium]